MFFLKGGCDAVGVYGTVGVGGVQMRRDIVEVAHEYAIVGLGRGLGDVVAFTDELCVCGVDGCGVVLGWKVGEDDAE